MSVDSELKEMMRKEINKFLSKLRYKVNARIVGDNQIASYNMELPFPPYIGLKLKFKIESDSYFKGRIIDVEWDDDDQVFYVICEVY